MSLEHIKYTNKTKYDAATKDDGTVYFVAEEASEGPEAYIKSASVSGNTLTLTKEDDTTVPFTPAIPTTYVKSAEVSGKNITFTKEDDTTVAYTPTIPNKLYTHHVTLRLSTGGYEIGFVVTDKTTTAFTLNNVVAKVNACLGGANFRLPACGKYKTNTSPGYNILVTGISTASSTTLNVHGLKYSTASLAELDYVTTAVDLSEYGLTIIDSVKS